MLISVFLPEESNKHAPRQKDNVSYVRFICLTDRDHFKKKGIVYAYAVFFRYALDDKTCFVDNMCCLKWLINLTKKTKFCP